MTKIEKPGKGTKIRETTRVTAEAGMSLLPGGGILNSVTRRLLPSKLDKQKADWQEDVIVKGQTVMGLLFKLA